MAKNNTCTMCKHISDYNQKDNPESMCYLCKRNSTDNRIDWYDDIRDSYDKEE